jgi:IS30 family transposase
MKYSQLTLDDRINIHLYLQQNFTYEEIGKKIKKHKSTISREIQRNKGSKGYRYKQAHNYYLIRKSNLKKYKRLTVPLQRLIEKKIRKDWSPEQISNWLYKKEKGSISHETIYKFIQHDKEMGGDLHHHLRQRNKKRRKKYSSGKTSKGTIKNRVSIDKRPKIVEQEKRVGDFEGDTIVGKNHLGSIVTIVDRKSLYLKMAILPDRTSKSVTKSITKILSPFKEKIHTITFDNGKEFADHEIISQKLDTKIYFAKPYSFWQRAINENTNGLIRQYFPKKTDFTKITKKDIARIERALNNRPRKKLDFKTPKEVFFGNSS